ncbi:hypothetical protein KR009_006437 [Drosophila setifemur]|nr:hypothetical protein KR009_006437 [Drosophila setifemur]
MKSVVLILTCLALSCQARVVQIPEKAIEIPVTIIEDKPALEALALVKEESLPQKLQPQVEDIKPLILEDKAREIVEEIKPEIVEEIKPEIKEELKPEIKPEIKQELKPEIKTGIKPLIKEEIKPEIKEEIKPEIKEEIKPEIKEEIIEKIKDLKPEIKPEIKEEIQELKEELPAQPLEEQPKEIKEEKPKEIKEELPEIKEEPKPIDTVLKTLPAEAEEPAQELSPNPVQQDQSEIQDSVHPQVRQATQATPTQQSTTQGNFVQQLIQNSPIGQFLNQFQPQQQQQPAPAQPLADDADAAAPATPAPTVPGFLNPQAAFTSAQQVVQNAAQTVVNSTTQAFQGIQQFASNLGNQFQNTLSGFANPQAAVSTTPRPPGPIQQFVNNVFGGGNATAAAPAQNQQQSGNPLQGIINFLGGNRPQNAPAAALVTEAPAKKPEVDDKIDPNANDEVVEFVPESENEIRASGESIDDSFEEAAVPTNEVIVVNDDASEGGVEVSDPVQPHPADVVDAVAL